MICLALLTGFLGAGKTTFLNHILEEYAGERVGLVVNEFSSTAVDGALVRRDAPQTQMVELSGGSIFCACIKDSFVDALIALSKRPLDWVFVEASGLADPASISSILDQLGPLAQVKYDYRGSICLVDALHFGKLQKLLPALQRQVQYSRAVVINKTDLVDDATLDEVEACIRALNPAALCCRTTYAQASLKALLAGDRTAELAPQESSNTPAARPQTVTLVTAEAVLEADLRRFLAEIGPSTYRMKGFCKTTEGTLNVSTVGEVCQMECWPIVVAQTELVIISSVGVRIVSEILRAAETCFHSPVELRS